MFHHHLVQALIILSPLGSLYQPLKWSSSLSSVLSSNSGTVILANDASKPFSRIEEPSKLFNMACHILLKTQRDPSVYKA